MSRGRLFGFAGDRSQSDCETGPAAILPLRRQLERDEIAFGHIQHFRNSLSTRLPRRFEDLADSVTDGIGGSFCGFAQPVFKFGEAWPWRWNCNLFDGQGLSEGASLDWLMGIVTEYPGPMTIGAHQ
jgi:hypothetical protein